MNCLNHTYDQAADRLGVSEKTIRRLVADGLLPVVKIRGARRISDEDLIEYNRKCREIACPTEKPEQKTGTSLGRKTDTNVLDLAARLITQKREG